MKLKIFALVAFILCFGVLLVSCGEESAQEPQQPTACTAPVDENGDGMCDSCGHAYIAPVEQIPVMEVKPIPEGVSVSDYFDFVLKNESVALTKYNALIGGAIAGGAGVDGRVIVLKYTNPISDETVPESEWQNKDFYTVYDVVAKKELHTFTSEAYAASAAAPKDTYTFTCADYYFCEQKTVKEFKEMNGTQIEVVTNTWRFYTVTGDSIGTFNSIDGFNQEIVGDVCYLTIDDTVATIDIETGARVRLVGSNEVVYGDVDTFVKRPAFDDVIGTYGYVFEYDNDGYVGVQVYDLSSWLKCVYSYEIPSYVLSEKTVVFTLRNGNVLVQTLVPLHENNKVFDFVRDGVKFDVVYTILNAVDKTETEVEFGYFITENYSAEDYQYAKDTAQNIITVSPITDKLVNFSEQRTMVVDNDLNILCTLEKYLPGQISDEKTPVGDDLYVVELLIGDEIVEAVINGSGELVTYLPKDYIEGDGFILAGEKIYGYDMTIKFDLYNNGNEYSVVDITDNCIILKKANITDETKYDYFYYNATLRAPQEIAMDGSSKQYGGMLGDSLFVIKEGTIIDNTSVAYQYVIYNTDNVRLASFIIAPQLVGVYENTTVINVDGIYYVFD